MNGLETNTEANPKKIHNFIINCGLAETCSALAVSERYDLFNRVRNYCSKKGVGCTVGYHLTKLSVRAN
jgi:hypothetical protein